MNTIHQMTKEQAMFCLDEEVYRSMSSFEIAKHQIFHDRLFVPFGVFHEAVEKTLGRIVEPQELYLNRDGIKKEIFSSTKRSERRRKTLIEKGIREVRGIERPIELHKEIKRKINELYPKK